MERFVKIDHADIIQELCIESGVQKMQYCMLHTADIHIYRQIFVCFLSRNQFFIIVIVYIAKEVPGRSCPLRHGVCLSPGRFPTYRALAVHPLVDRRKR